MKLSTRILLILAAVVLVFGTRATDSLAQTEPETTAEGSVSWLERSLPQRPVERMFGLEADQELPKTWFVGRFHAVLVHLPVGLLIGLFFLELAAIAHRKGDYRPATRLLSAFTAWSALVAMLTGFLLSLGGDYPAETLAGHTWAGVGLALFSWLLWRVKVRHGKNGGIGLGVLYGVLLILCIGLMKWGAYQGISLTHGKGYLTRHMPESWRSTLLGPTPPPEPGLTRADIDEALAVLDAKGVTIVPIAQTDPGLVVNFSVASESVTDDSLVPLAPLLPHVRQLNLAGTEITDEALTTLRTMPGLARLHLERTGITDAGLADVAAVPTLEYLNLHSTDVTDAGLTNLVGLTGLRSLYIWQTGVTSNGVTQLQTALPDLEIVLGVALPDEPVAEDGEDSTEEETPEQPPPPAEP